MFSLVKKDGLARTGVLHLRSGDVKTPFFMPVATFASGRNISAQDYEQVGTQVIITNAFLLSLRPGEPVVNKMGGIDSFMNFKGGVFTDSGGFQSSSEEMYVKTTKNAVHLKSPFDGSPAILTPKRVMEIEQLLRSDVAMVIDDMAPPNSSKEEFMKALNNTHRWAQQCKESHSDTKQLLFAIVQGGYDADLRRKSAETLVSIGFDGYAIGGCAIGEPKPDMYRAVRNSVPYLPLDKPRYLMGVGSPPDIVEAVSLGVDCFDSIFPTMNARHNRIFTMKGPYQINRGAYSVDESPLEDGCDCWVCAKHSKAYIKHLSSINEHEGKRLRQVHNIRFMMRLMEKIRKSISDGVFSSFKREFLHDWFNGDVPKWHENV